MRFYRIFTPILLSSFIFAGCSSTPNISEDANLALQNGYLTPFSTIDHSSDWYKSIFDNAEPQDQFNYAILVARSYIAEKNFEKAKIWLDYANKNSYTQLQESRVKLATAEFLYAQNKYENVLTTLKKINSLQSFSNRESAHYYVFLANSQKKLGDVNNAYKNYIRLNQFITDKESATFKKNQEAIVSILLSKNVNELRNLKSNAQNEEELGYLDFAINRLSVDASQYAYFDANWLERYPDHPAKVLIDLANINNNGNQPININMNGDINQIAVIMPLTGKLGSYGDAFRQGIMVAQQEQRLSSNIRFYDVNGKDVLTVYDQAIADGAQFVVGPLTKENVSKVINNGIKVPTLAINSFDYVSVDNAFFFALSPENEGAQAAKKIYEDMKQTPLLIVPETDKGNRIIDGFQREWFHNVNSNPIIIKRFKNRADVTTAITEGLSQGNVDAVYLCGSAMEVSLIKSQMQVSFPGNRDYYITNNSNPGSLKASVTKNMKGIYIGDMPWLLQDSDLKDTIKESLDISNINILTFFALGYDSITIVPNIKTMAENGIPVNGLTGKLYVNEQGKVNTEVEWDLIQ